MRIVLTMLAKFICALALASWAPTATAVDFAVNISRDSANYYVGKSGFQGVIKTQLCFEFVFFDNATLRLTAGNTGTLIFSSGQQCQVMNVFDPATVAAGNYSASVNSNVDGYYEFTDGSFLLKATGFDFNFNAAAILNLTSAANGFASGTIAISGRSTQQLSNIYYSRQPAPLQSQSITFGVQSSQEYIYGGAFFINPVATASSGLAITYTASPANVCTMGAGTIVNMAGAGTCTVTASQFGNSSYSAATPVSQSAVISWEIFHSCAVVSGGVQCWGSNINGELGNNSTLQSSVPVQTIPAGSNATAVSVGLYHACAVVNGGAQCWGYNGNGQLGNNTLAQTLVPVQAIGSGSGVTAISAGNYHTCAVVSGGVKCWGYNGDGELGNNSTTQSMVPVQAIAAGSNSTDVAAGYYHSCAVVNGGVQCWGYNGNGQLGNNSTTQSSVPVQAIVAGNNSVSVAASRSRSCAVVNSGVQCWGYNGNGQLGNNSTATSLVPVQAVAAGNGSTSVTTGLYHSCASVSGGVQCWGYNGDGELGNNSTTQSLIPVQAIPPGNNATTLMAGTYHTCATVNGGVKCWGDNGFGQLGNNSTTQSLIPVNALILGSPPQSQTITFTPVSTVTLGVAPITLRATATSGLTTFAFLTSSASSVCQVSGNLLTIVGVGTCSLTASQGGNANFSSAIASATVNIATSQPAITFIGVQSRKQHGAIGTFDVWIDPTASLSGAVSVEPRTSATGQLIVFQFSGPVTSAGTATATDPQSNSYNATPTKIGSEVTIFLSGVPNNKRVTISLNGVDGSLNQSAPVGFLVGDVNGSLAVKAADVAAVKAHLGQVASANNFVYDVNASGAIDTSDVSVVKSQSGRVLQ